MPLTDEDAEEIKRAVKLQTEAWHAAEAVWIERGALLNSGTDKESYRLGYVRGYTDQAKKIQALEEQLLIYAKDLRERY